LRVRLPPRRPERRCPLHLASQRVVEELDALHHRAERSARRPVPVGSSGPKAAQKRSSTEGGSRYPRSRSIVNCSCDPVRGGGELVQ
jgi:hypothetical protein